MRSEQGGTSFKVRSIGHRPEQKTRSTSGPERTDESKVGKEVPVIPAPHIGDWHRG